LETGSILPIPSTIHDIFHLPIWLFGCTFWPGVEDPYPKCVPVGQPSTNYLNMTNNKVYNIYVIRSLGSRIQRVISRKWCRPAGYIIKSQCIYNMYY
jgi:hypothetical protein